VEAVGLIPSKGVGASFFFWTHFILEYKLMAKPSCNYERLHL
jgi:hypothetical protein